MKKRRISVVILIVFGVAGWLVFNSQNYEAEVLGDSTIVDSSERLTAEVLEEIAVKGRAPKTGYSREEFYTNWPDIEGCDARNVILARDLTNVVFDGCLVLSGVLNDPYTGKIISFRRGSGTSSEVQIDHVVALSNAWQTGASYMEKAKRKAMASDPLNLLAVDGPANMQKSDGDAATWLPANKSFRCRYVSRQVAVKFRYSLWVTEPEKEAILRVLSSCPSERVVSSEKWETSL